MSINGKRRFRAGDTLDDLCRVCKTVRAHSIIVTDLEAQPLRVICDYCGSQHNYRGGDSQGPGPMPPSGARASEPIGLVSERERQSPPVNLEEQGKGAPDLELLLRRIIREESGLTPVSIAEKWRGGDLVLKPGKAGLQEKAWPIETFFHKVVMLRNRLRVLEQQINGMDIPEDQKVKLQSYVTGCYGTLTSFNVLFAEEEDRFRGAAGGD
jgi:hypothetical protein